MARGANGRTATTTVTSAGGEPIALPSKFTSHRMAPGDVIEFRTACGGGYGEPRERDPDAVARDVRDGLVSVGAARRDYGVVIDADTLAVDTAATELERSGER